MNKYETEPITTSDNAPSNAQKHKKTKKIILFTAIVLAIALIAAFLIDGFFGLPKEYLLHCSIFSTEFSGYEFLEMTECKVGDTARIGATLFNGKQFFPQTIVYADTGPIFCKVVIETKSGIKTETVELFDNSERDDGSKNAGILRSPYTTLESQRLGAVYYNKMSAYRETDYTFTEAGTYTFTFYAAFMQNGKMFYVEQTPNSEGRIEFVITVSE